MLVDAITTLLVTDEETGVRQTMDFIGTPIVALLIAVLYCYVALGLGSGMNKSQVSDSVGSALPGIASIILIVAAGIVAPLAPTLSANHLALLVLAIGCGSLFFSHVNDAGFWLVKEYFGLTVGETIKSWSVMETVISVFGFALVMLASVIVT